MCSIIWFINRINLNKIRYVKQDIPTSLLITNFSRYVTIAEIDIILDFRIKTYNTARQVYLSNQSRI